jgi:hypothetical protein
MCEFFDAVAPQQCREPVADHVSDKSRANFCGYFNVNPHAFATPPDQADVSHRELEALFVDASSGSTTEADASEDALQDELEQLFRK